MTDNGSRRVRAGPRFHLDKTSPASTSSSTIHPQLSSFLPLSPHSESLLCTVLVYCVFSCSVSARTGTSTQLTIHQSGNMAAAIKSALPSRLKPEGDGEDNGFEGRHHGKTRSHMVSQTGAAFTHSHSCPSAFTNTLIRTVMCGCELRHDVSELQELSSSMNILHVALDTANSFLRYSKLPTREAICVRSYGRKISTANRSSNPPPSFTHQGVGILPSWTRCPGPQPPHRAATERHSYPPCSDHSLPSKITRFPP